MAPRKIIADSDDEEEDFSPAPSPEKQATPSTASERPPSNYASGSDLNSNDPQYLQKRYKDQQEHNNPTVAGVTDGNEDSLGSVAPHASQPKKADDQQSSLTSVPDPVHASKQMHRGNLDGSLNFTQVTTPGRSSTNKQPKDVWDIPSSPEEGRSGRRFRLDNKGSTGSVSKALEGGGQYASANIGRPTPTSTQPNSTAEHNIPRRDLTTEHITMLSADDPSGAFTDVSTYNEGVGSDANKLPVLHAPNVGAHILSNSQQQLYHTDHPPCEDHRLLSTAHPNGEALGCGSSSTIAYATPSQFKDSAAPRAPELNSSDATGSPTATRNKRARASSPGPASSPDVICMGSGRRKRNKTSPAPPEESEPRLNELDNSHIHDEPRSSRRRHFRGEYNVADNARDGLNTDEPRRVLFDPVPDSLPPPRRRGRPRKSETRQQSGQDAVEPVGASEGLTAGSGMIKPPQPVAAMPVAEPATKKKRGRPKKAQKESNAAQEQAVLPTPTSFKENGNAPALNEAQISVGGDATAATVGTSTKHDLVSGHEESQDDQTDRHDPGVQARQGDNLDQPAQPAASKRGTAEGARASRKDTEEESSVRGDVNEAEQKTPRREASLPASSAGKPLYRVGLSKRSRIAPLLKSLRKT